MAQMKTGHPDVPLLVQNEKSGLSWLLKPACAQGSFLPIHPPIFKHKIQGAQGHSVSSPLPLHGQAEPIEHGCRGMCKSLERSWAGWLVPVILAPGGWGWRMQVKTPVQISGRIMPERSCLTKERNPVSFVWGVGQPGVTIC